MYYVGILTSEPNIYKLYSKNKLKLEKLQQQN